MSQDGGCDPICKLIKSFVGKRGTDRGQRWGIRLEVCDLLKEADDRLMVGERCPLMDQFGHQTSRTNSTGKLKTIGTQAV